MGKPSGNNIIARSQSSQKETAKAFAAGGGKSFSAVSTALQFSSAQKSRINLQYAMSALPAKADMCSALADVCFGPKADMACYGCKPPFFHKSSKDSKHVKC
jgi:hypothetical protein